MMFIEPMKDKDIVLCASLVLANWGPVAADRYVEQAYEGMKGGKYVPKFFVARLWQSGDPGSGIVGFAAYQRTMRMRGAFDLIWLAVHKTYQGQGIGHELTQHRIDEIIKLDGTAVFLVTQKPKFFQPFSFNIAVNLGNDWVEMVRLLKPADMGSDHDPVSQ